MLFDGTLPVSAERPRHLPDSADAPASEAQVRSPGGALHAAVLTLSGAFHLGVAWGGFAGANVRGDRPGGPGWGDREGDPTGPRQGVDPGAPSAGGGVPAAASRLEQLLTLPPGVPLPFPTFRVVEETQGGGGGEDAHALPA